MPGLECYRSFPQVSRVHLCGSCRGVLFSSGSISCWGPDWCWGSRFWGDCSRELMLCPAGLEASTGTLPDVQLSCSSLGQVLRSYTCFMSWPEAGASKGSVAGGKRAVKKKEGLCCACRVLLRLPCDAVWVQDVTYVRPQTTPRPKPKHQDATFWCDGPRHRGFRKPWILMFMWTLGPPKNF